MGEITSLAAARARVDRNPSKAQIEAGNYRKGHVSVQGLDVTIENPRGSIRRGAGWARRMHADYGYVKRTDGADGDHVDVFLGPHLTSPLAFVVNQIDSGALFDEHKVMLGYRRLPDAFAGYRAHYPDTWTMGPITTLTMDELKSWLAIGDTQAPLPEWHRPCLWADFDRDGPEPIIAKAVEFVVRPDGRISAMEVLAKSDEIRHNPHNFLGVDRRGRAHWRSPLLPAQMELPMSGPSRRQPNTTTILPLDQYDKILVSFSGGKDSLALVLDLLERGVPREKIELWHQLVDGEPGSAAFMDWPITESYVKKIADALGLPLRFQWREGGFYGELIRENAPKAPAAWQDALGQVSRSTPTGPRSEKGWNRKRWPAPTKDLNVRWCSAFLKIEIARSAIAHDERFQQPGTRILFLTGERREEGGGRKFYADAIRHSSTTHRRRVDQWRPILDWSEKQVWAIMQRWKVRPHPAYQLGFGRVSCLPCIFGRPDQWATIRAIAPERFDALAHMEQRLEHTINAQGKPLADVAAAGRPWVTDNAETHDLVALAMSHDYTPTVIVPDQWQLPRGAFKGEQTGGPT